MSSTKTILAAVAFAAVVLTTPVSAAACFGTAEVCAKMRQPVEPSKIYPFHCFGTLEACGLKPAIVFEDDADAEQFHLLQSIRSNARDVIKSLSHPMRRNNIDNTLILEEEDDSEQKVSWEANAGISGQFGKRPNIGVGISAKWDEAEEEMNAAIDSLFGQF